MRSFIAIIVLLAFIGSVHAQSAACNTSSSTFDTAKTIDEAHQYLIHTNSSCPGLDVGKNTTQCVFTNTTSQISLGCACVASYTNESLTNFTSVVAAANGRVCFIETGFSITGSVNIINATNVTTTVPVSLSVTHTNDTLIAIPTNCSADFGGVLKTESAKFLPLVNTLIQSIPEATFTTFIIKQTGCDANSTVVGVIKNGQASIPAAEGSSSSSTGTTGNNTVVSSSSSSSGTSSGNNTVSSSSSSSSTGGANTNTNSSSGVVFSSSSSSTATGNSTTPGGMAATIGATNTFVVVAAAVIATLIL